MKLLAPSRGGTGVRMATSASGLGLHSQCSSDRNLRVNPVTSQTPVAPCHEKSFVTTSNNAALIPVSSVELISLHIAAGYGHKEVVHKLIDSGKI